MDYTLTDNLDLIHNTNLNVTTKEDVLMLKLTKYYFNTDKIYTMIKIINGESEVSLRLTDWFVTNYTKKNEIIYYVDGKQFNPHKSYKNKLTGYQKKLFDPFQRRDRIKFYYRMDEYVITTPGQLNFFFWAKEFGVIDYILKNRKEIEKDMNLSLRKSAENKKKTNKRQELSKSIMKQVNKQNIKITLTFD